MFSKKKTNRSIENYSETLKLVKEKLMQADAVVIGAGAGLSTAAGFTYSGERFSDYFGDFQKQYGFTDMYAGGFYAFASLEEYWAYWSRYIYVNRYMDAPKPVYADLLQLVGDHDYFVLTTNVDHCFQKAGFEKQRIFYTQGDYGLFQCSGPCHQDTYDNEDLIRKMVLCQGFAIKDGILVKPEHGTPAMKIPTELVPYCERCGRPMTMNLRADSTFVQDAGWEAAAERYENFMLAHRGKKVVFLELGVGYNTPGIIKYHFWQYTQNWQQAFYVCVNRGQAEIPPALMDKAVGIDADIVDILGLLLT